MKILISGLRSQVSGLLTAALLATSAVAQVPRVTSAQTISDKLVLPAKADPVSPTAKEAWLSSTTTDRLKYRNAGGTTTFTVAVTADIGTSLQAWDADLDALAAVTTAADKIAYFTGSHTAAVTDFTTTARSLLDDTSTSAMRATLGVAIGSDVQAYDTDLAYLAGFTPTANVKSILNAADYAAVKTLLSLTIGTDVQAYNLNLAAIAGLTTSSDKVTYWTGSGSAAVTAFTTWARNQAAITTLTSTALLLGSGTSAVTASDMTYSSPTWSVPDAFNVSGAGSINLTAGGSNKNIKLTPSGTGGIIAQSGSISLLLGADAGAVTLTDTTTKAGRLGVPHYTNAQIPLAMLHGTSTSTTGVVNIGGGTSGMNAATAVDVYTAANNTTAIGTRRGGWNSSGNMDLTGTLSVGNTTNATSISTGAFTTTGGGSFAKDLFLGGLIDQGATVTLPVGTRNAINLVYNGTGDSGGTSVLIAINTAPVVQGAQNVSQIRGMYINPRNNLDSGKTLADEYGNFIDIFNIGAGATTNGYGQYTRPRTSSTGGFTNFTYSKFDTGVYSGGTPGDITGAIIGVDAADIGRAAASSVTVFNVGNQTKPTSGSLYGYRGQISSGSGKWNAYLDGTASIYIAGETQIGSATDQGAYALQVTGDTYHSGSITTNGSSLWSVTAVNSVSPTSPNRTVTFVYNGTTYYVAAKTTND